MKKTIKYIRPEALSESLLGLTKNLHVSHGLFTIAVPGLLEDMEWNHMDQMHRPFIHNTYEEGLRLAYGTDFALSITRWGNWPLFIPVTDVRLKPGLYYQAMVIAGLINLHNVISMVQKDEAVELNVEWYITSHKWLRFTHGLLSRKLYNLNTRLQKEDHIIRAQRYELRRQGYRFATEPVDFFTSNQMTNNTIYPAMAVPVEIPLAEIAEGMIQSHQKGKHVFLAQRAGDEVRIWPGVCPHEGADLMKGCLKDGKIKCHWHGLKFVPAILSPASPEASAYGFTYRLEGERIEISMPQAASNSA